MPLPLTIRLKCSPVAAIALLLAHGSAAVSLWLIESPLSVKGLLAAAIAISTLRTLPTHALRLGRGAVLAITLRENGEIELAHADGRRVMARVLADSTVFSWLLVLLLDSAGKRLALPLLADGVDKEGFRQLQIWLRWQCARAREGSAPANEGNRTG